MKQRVKTLFAGGLLALTLFGVAAAGPLEDGQADHFRTRAAINRAADLLPIIADIKASGAASLRAIAAELNSRGIPAARGGEWSAIQVARVLERSD